jgi:hypothetical protein
MSAATSNWTLSATTLKDIVGNALKEALALNAVTPVDRSREWIRALARGLDSYAQGTCADVATLHKHMKAEAFHRGSQQRSEYLFDILCCQMGVFTPPKNVQAAPVDFIVRTLVQVESEFEPNTPDSAEDFSKLVCGSAPVSLFVGPLPSTGSKNYRTALANIAPYVNGACFLAFIPHPKDWPGSTAVFELYQWVDGSWAQC